MFLGRNLVFVKKVSEYRKLSPDDEISSIVYATLCSVSKLESIQGTFRNFNPLVFIVKSLYDENFPILGELSFITRDGGARYVMNDVSSYRAAKGYDVPEVNHLSDLFSRYGCSNYIDIVNFIYEVYLVRDSDELIGDDAIRRALMAYRVYYKNNISISYLPDFKTVADENLRIFNNSMIKRSDFVSSVSNFSGSSYGTKSVTFTHLKYPEVKMMIVADGTGDVLDENISYVFCDRMNEWFWNCKPYSSNFSHSLEDAITDINAQISLDNHALDTASVSVLVCTNKAYYVSSIGTTRIYLIKGNYLERIERPESLYDVSDSTADLSFADFMKGVPADYIGYGTVDSSKGNVRVLTLPSYDLDGALLVTKSVYDNISDEELESIVASTDSSSVLESISGRLPLNVSSSLAIYQKKERAVRRLFSRRK